MKLSNKLKLSIIIIMLFTIIVGSLSITSTSYAIVKEPRMNVKTLSLAKKSKYTIRVYNTTDYTVSFSSSDTKVVYIKEYTNSSCCIRTKSPGLAYITASLTNDTSGEVTALKCKVKVSPLAISIKLPKKKLKLTVGQSVRLKYNIKPNISAEQPRFVSEHPSVASVSSTGMVTALAPGKVNIRAYISNGRFASCKFTISAKTDSDNPAKTEKPLTTAPPSTASPEATEVPPSYAPIGTPVPQPSQISRFVANCDE